MILNPKYIVIHHSVTPGDYNTGLNVIKRQEQAFGKNSVKNSYHFIVSKEGHIITWKPENLVIGHCGFDGYTYSDEPCNFNSLAVCFLGNFEIEEVPKIQLEVGKVLIKSLVKKYKIKDVVGHRDIISTSCPGKNLYKLIPEIKEEIMIDKWEEEVIKFAHQKGWIKELDLHLSKAKEPFSRAEALATLMNFYNTFEKEMLTKIVIEILKDLANKLEV